MHVTAYLCADLFDIFFLLPQQRVEILFVHNFYVGLTLSLLVFQGAVQQQYSGVLDSALHLGVGGVLVEHDTIQYAAFSQLAAGNLLDADVALDIDLGVVGSADHDLAHGLHGDVHHLGAPSARELGADGGHDYSAELIVIVHVNDSANAVAGIEDGGEGLAVAVHNHGGVEVSLQQGLGQGEHLATQDDDGGGSVAYFLVLCTRQLDHALCGGVTDVHLSQYTVAVVGDDDAAHGVQQHLKHGAGAQCSPDDVGHSLCPNGLQQLRNKQK
jgi:hypothetical protein